MRWLLLCLALLGSIGCRGPKGAPDSSVKSFYSAAGAEDWGAMADTVSASSVARLGGRAQVEAFLARQFSGWSHVDVSIDDWSVDADGKKATVRFSCLAQILQNYKPVKVDCGDTHSLVREDDGKWHLVLPGAQRLRPL